MNEQMTPDLYSLHGSRVLEFSLRGLVTVILCIVPQLHHNRSLHGEVSRVRVIVAARSLSCEIVRSTATPVQDPMKAVNREAVYNNRV